MTACTYYEDNQPGMALMDADPPHVRRCPRCDGVVVIDGGNWCHDYDGPFTLEQHARDMGESDAD